MKRIRAAAVKRYLQAPLTAGFCRGLPFGLK